MPFEVKGYIPSIKPGAYQAVCTQVEERSAKADPTNLFRVWSFQLTDGSLRTIEGTSSLASSPKSKGGKWLAALLGRTPAEGETVEPEGKACTIIVAIKETTGYEYVETVTAPMSKLVDAAALVARQAAPTGEDGMEVDESPNDPLPF